MFTQDWSGHFLPFSRILPLSQSKIATLFPNTMLRKFNFFFFFYFFRDHYYLWETMTHIRMKLKHLCLSGMVGIIQSKITWFWGYILPLLCSTSLISPNLSVKSIIFSQFWPGAFFQNCWKKPCWFSLDLFTQVWFTQDWFALSGVNFNLETKSNSPSTLV